MAHPGGLPAADGDGNDAERADRQSDGGGRYVEVAHFLRGIYEEKAAEMGGEMTANALIARMATVWNQRRLKHVAAVRQQQELRQQVSALGHGKPGPEAVAARKQAALDAAQAKAKAHRHHQAVLAELQERELSQIGQEA